MIDVRLPVSLGAVALLAACTSPPQGNDAAAAASPRPSSGSTNPVVEKASLSPKPVAGFPDISIPEVGGIDAAAASRINAALATVRDQAAVSARECSQIAEGRPFSYGYAAQPTYNDKGVLSLRITGEAGCGGARGTMLTAAHTFDLSSGAEIDVVEASGRTPAALATLAAQEYEGGADCKTFVAGDGATLASAFVTPRGVGVNYSVDAGAAEGCTAEPGLASWTALATGGKLKEPLATLARS
ncbi:hypothetical protein [Sphingomonas rubra]|uniref:Uncharacterized protein n=1 Tax=Sphingomonas rubra TaxID=634430 RepID=A0A1I5UG74_9SPHN|nr:hypothetical protein [Sphingomonas rubra]SFP94047.1 hypothetical protein SAMN04488241_111144 [Sphingomonas rubra]